MPTSRSHPGKPAACWCDYPATGLQCHLSLNMTTKRRLETTDLKYHGILFLKINKIKLAFRSSDPSPKKRGQRKAKLIRQFCVTFSNFNSQILPCSVEINSSGGWHCPVRSSHSKENHFSRLVCIQKFCHLDFSF